MKNINNLNNNVVFFNSLDINNETLKLDDAGLIVKDIKLSSMQKFFRWVIHLITFTRVPLNPDLDKIAQEFLNNANNLNKNLTVYEKNQLLRAVKILDLVVQNNCGSFSSKLKKLTKTIEKINTIASLIPHFPGFGNLKKQLPNSTENVVFNVIEANVLEKKALINSQIIKWISRFSTEVIEKNKLDLTEIEKFDFYGDLSNFYKKGLKIHVFLRNVESQNKTVLIIQNEGNPKLAIPNEEQEKFSCNDEGDLNIVVYPNHRPETNEFLLTIATIIDKRSTVQFSGLARRQRYLDGNSSFAKLKVSLAEIVWKDTEYEKCGRSYFDTNPIKYEKFKQKTWSFVPTDKRMFARGLSGKIYNHRYLEDCVIKKSFDNLENEYNIGIQVDHPNIVNIKKLFIKNNNQTTRYKLLMEKIEGQTFQNLYENSDILSLDIINKLLLQAQNCCLYLFDKEIAWTDINFGNIFLTKTKDLKLCDLGLWSIEKDFKIRAQKLFLGSLEITGHLIKNLLLKIDSKNEEFVTGKAESALIFPEEFFEKEIVEELIIGSYLSEFDSREWLVTIKNKIASMNENQVKNLLKTYFDLVIQKIAQTEKN